MLKHSVHAELIEVLLSNRRGRTCDDVRHSDVCTSTMYTMLSIGLKAVMGH